MNTITGRELFEMHVRHYLCTGEYRWEALSEEIQRRWNEMAKQLALADKV